MIGICKSIFSKGWNSPGVYFFVPLLLACALQGAEPVRPAPDEVRQITEKVAHWQVETFEEANRCRAVPRDQAELMRQRGQEYPRAYLPLVWQNAVFYTGLIQWCRVAEDPDLYLTWLRKLGRRCNWDISGRDPYSADDYAVGRLYLGLYDAFGSDYMIKPLRNHLDRILDKPNTGSLSREAGNDWLKRWGWCDALFMGPAVWAGLARVSGEEKYLEFMNREYHATYDLLWDTDEHLFWRDSGFFESRELNGKKLFWARGNGWVIAGLALTIPELPEHWDGRPFYVDLYRQLAARLIQCQRADGTWSMGLLGDAEAYPDRETSGTGLITFGLAWGINAGLLDREVYEPAVLNGWQALTGCVRDDGLLGNVQPVGDQPGDVFADKSEVYGVGAFLAAGAEIYKLVDGK